MEDNGGCRRFERKSDRLSRMKRPLKKMKQCRKKLNSVLLQELKGKENVTLDGRKINIYANIGSVGDIGNVMENDAGRNRTFQK